MSALLRFSLRGLIRNAASRKMSGTSSQFLINDPKYSWIRSELNLEERNMGVFDGSWHAKGRVSGEPNAYKNRHNRIHDYS